MSKFIYPYEYQSHQCSIVGVGELPEGTLFTCPDCGKWNFTVWGTMWSTSVVRVRWYHWNKKRMIRDYA